ncbi:unnamed protein product [Peronospora farinosa]|uniref:GTP-binding protein Parf n=1 Tax=Peronospora farinosa TaxID=134698 RepID=A0AAV0TY67_9STRA|nr:unnamed protein product [Peronospora farinosa]CAI5727042.1 unnamed protein product [Peronospora farinosa]
MKLLIRGAKGTGKTSLFQRLKGELIPETHQSTPQLQSATINWKFRENLEENVKCEVWDVVDQGFVPMETVNGGEEGGGTRGKTAAIVEQEGLQSQKSLSAGRVTAAMQNGTHSMAVVDASTVNVYHVAHGVIFLLDITKWDTLEYVKQQLDNVPVHIPTLVLGNFRDQGAQRKIFKEDIQEMLYGSRDRPQPQQWRRPTELLYFECSLLNCYGLKSLHQYFGIPFLQLKLATIRQQMRIVEGEFTHLKHDVQATIMEQRYAEYVAHIKTTGSDIRTGRRSSASGSTSRAVTCSNVANSSFSDIDPGKTAQDGTDNRCKENDAETPIIALTTQTPQKNQEVTESQDMKDLPARNSSGVSQATSSLKFQHKENMASIPDDATDVNVPHIKGEHALPNGKNSESSLLNHASPNCPRKVSMEEVIHLEDFQVPKTRISDLNHFYSEDESDEDIGGNDEDVVVAPADGLMKANTSGVYHKQRFLDSDSDSDENESTRVQRRRNGKVSRKRSPHRRATKQANATTGWTILRPHESSQHPPSPHPPPTAPPSIQRSRPGSPARSEPSSPVNGSQIVPREEPLKHWQSVGPTNKLAPTPTQPAVLRTSTSASLARQSSPRSKSKNSSAPTNSEMGVIVLQSEIELKNESSSSEEPGFTGTENSASLCGQESPQTSPKQKGSKNLSCKTHSSTNGANDNALISTTTYATEKKEMSAYAIDNDINSGPANDLCAPAQNQKDFSIRKDGGPTDAGMNGLCVDGPNTILAHDGKEECKYSAAATSQETEDADMLHDVVAPSSPQCHPQVRMSDEKSDGDTSDSTGSTKSPLLSLNESVLLPEVSAPPTSSMQSNTDGVESVTSQGVKDTMGHYHKRNMCDAGDFHSLSALQASLSLPGETTLPLPSILHESTQAPMDLSNCVSDLKTDAAPRLSDLQTIPSEALASTLGVPDLTTVVPSNDLEAFLNESDSDLEKGPSSSDAGFAGGNKQSKKQQRVNRNVIVESSDDSDEEGDQDRFASYSISKKNRSERRRQQKEDLLQLDAVLNMKNGPLLPSASVAAATDSSFVTSGVMEAIRKAQEDAMRMLPADTAPIIVQADSNLSKKRHTHKHKKKHKSRTRTTPKRD